MPGSETAIAAVLVISLTLYALMGGADFGGGVWDLLAWGPRAKAQRRLIAAAIGPIWEANHVWLILVIVVLFACFPPAFAVVSTALHIPLTLALVGIVLRGSAFVFRAHDRREERVDRRWSLLFAIASLVTPFLLGVTAGALASGNITAGEGGFAARFVWPWLAPFPLGVGLLAVVLFALLAAVYLTLETEDIELREDFRRRGIAATVAALVAALLVRILAREGAPRVFVRLTESWWGELFQAAGACLAGATLVTLWTRRYEVARGTAACGVTVVLWGWALAQFPSLVEPDITIHNAAAPPATLRIVLVSVACGAAVLFPSLYYLYRVFKGRGA